MARNRLLKWFVLFVALVAIVLVAGVAAAQPEQAGEATAQAASESAPAVMVTREVPTREAPVISNPANAGALDGCRTTLENGTCPAWYE